MSVIADIHDNVIDEAASLLERKMAADRWFRKQDLDKPHDLTIHQKVKQVKAGAYQESEGEWRAGANLNIKPPSY